jgi:hypothetical protein
MQSNRRTAAILCVRERDHSFPEWWRRELLILDSFEKESFDLNVLFGFPL